MNSLNPLKFYRIEDWVKNLGVTLIGILISENIDILRGTIALLLSSFLLGYAFSLNNYCDWEFGKERNYISKLKIKERNKIMLILFPFFASFFLVLIFFIYKLILLLSFFFFTFFYTFYSFPPRWKKDWKSSLFINTFCLGALLLFIGYFSQTNSLNRAFFIFLFLYLSYFLTSEILHQISHMEKDEKAGIKSFPNEFGIKKSVRLMQTIQVIVIGFSVSLIVFLQRILFIPLAIIVFSILRTYQIKKVKDCRSANSLRNKMYGTHEGVFYVFILIINFFFGFVLTPYLF
jgi:4-hydroxybenzoate polyprenyltransferase